MIWTLLLDGIIAALLVVTIVLAMILNRRFAGLRRDRLELSALGEEFHQAVARAEDSIARLKMASSGLASENRQAERLEDDLRQLVERADTAADRLEAAIRGTRTKPASLARQGNERVRPQAEKQAEPSAPVPVGPDSPAGSATAIAKRSAAERDLLEALRFKR